MKSARLDGFGGPERLVYGDLPDPRPKQGQVLIRVKAASINHLDIWVREGNPAYKIALPHVLGNDIAGEVAAVGPGVSPADLPRGSRVLVCPGISCWKCFWCKSGRDNLCEGYAILGADGGWGGYAELAAVPACNVLEIPADSMSYEEAASFPLTFLTAHHMLKTLAGAGPGQTVLVNGAGSGVGVAAIQIAKALGARVIAASTSEGKLDAAKRIGADETLHSPSEGLLKKTRKLTAGRGIDIVFDHVGGELFPETIKCLGKAGRLVTCGATAGGGVDLDLRYIFFKELQILGAKMGPLAELVEVNRLFTAGRLKAVVDRAFPLREARQAHEYLAERRQFGKVVLVP